MNTDAVIIDYFSGGIGEMRAKDQRDQNKVLRVLDADPEFTVFDATEREGIANTMDRLHDDGLIAYPEPRPGYPWMRVEITPAGLAILDAAIKTKGSIG
jgi:hypothetical protein